MHLSVPSARFDYKGIPWVQTLIVRDVPGHLQGPRELQCSCLVPDVRATYLFFKTDHTYFQAYTCVY